MSVPEQIRQKITDRLVEAAERVRGQEMISFSGIPDFVLEVPREKTHGDFATNLAMLLAKQVKMPPLRVAELIVDQFNPEGTWVTEVEVAGPGFINFRLDGSWLYRVLPGVLAQGRGYGRCDIGQGRRVQVEFVSANPTGLLHMGNARGAALGDTLASILDAAGYQVTREFYINDAGNQIEIFAKSLEARYLQLLGKEVLFPEEGYHGEDIIETMRELISRVGDRYLHVTDQERRQALVEFALKEKLDLIKSNLKDFGVHYDVWFSEETLHRTGAIDSAIQELKSKGYIYENEGALWFRSTQFGDEKDEVIVRSNGLPTYFAADIAYHKNKFERGFDWVINIWGADHHGHVARMKGAVSALGYDPDRLDVIIMQLVRLFKDGEIVRMSKRTGQYITLSELIEDVGRDAARYFFVMRSADSHLDFDMDLAKQQSTDNPVYYIQYAHARVCSILRQAAENSYAIPDADGADLSKLKEQAEYDLIRKMADLPDEVAAAAQALEPHRIARYAHDFAGLFHSYYNAYRVLVEDEATRNARLVLVQAVGLTLGNVLRLLGVSAPARM